MRRFIIGTQLGEVFQRLDDAALVGLAERLPGQQREQLGLREVLAGEPGRVGGQHPLGEA
ncbi:MAG TPA: hypothetical protein VKU02_15095 [Gemmataceae bacterium]|nr:hypothetical protein [Gemmataceae bacterium]